eukprot:1696782-Rhodomonas_salina.2
MYHMPGQYPHRAVTRARKARDQAGKLQLTDLAGKRVAGVLWHPLLDLVIVEAFIDVVPGQRREVSSHEKS